MARYLRQSEVDEILKYVEREKSSLADAGVTAGTVVRSYDFAAPAPVSKEALRSIHAIHESFLYSMVTSLSAHMRAMVEIDLISIDQMGYQEYLLSLNNPTVLCVFGMQPLGGEGVIEVHLPLVSAMVDRLFGGEGDLPARSRELTLIEQAVLSRIFSQSVQHLQKAWGEPEHLGLALKNIERNPQFLQVLSPSEVVLLVTFEVRVEQSNGLMSVCYPLMSLESILKRIEDRHSTHRVTPWGEESGENPLLREIRGIDVDVVAELGAADVAVRDILNLEVGDVLRLNERVDDDVKVKVGGVPKIYGSPGVARKRRAVLVRRVEGDLTHGG